MKKENIVYEIGEFCKDKNIENLSKLKNVMDSLDGSITPYELLNSMVNYMEGCTEECDEKYSKTQMDIMKIVMNDSKIREIRYDESGTNVGLSLISVGMKMMDLDYYSSPLVKKRIEDKTLSAEDIECLNNYGITLQDGSMKEKLEKYFENISEDECSGCKKHACDKKDNEAAVTSCNKEEIIKLIEDGRMSAKTVKQLINSDSIKITDLVNGLSEQIFYDIVSKMNGIKKDDLSSKDGFSDIPQSFKDCVANNDTEKIADIVLELKDNEKERRYMMYAALNEPNISKEESSIRRKIDNGSATNDEIIYAIETLGLNPFYLDAAGMSKERTEAIAKVLFKNMLNMFE